MKPQIIVSFVALLICGSLANAPGPSLETQITSLQKLGVRLRPGISIKHLLAVNSRQTYERTPYETLLVAMGGEPESPKSARLSDDVWHFDTECIESSGDYARIAERVQALADGDLPLRDIKDHVDLEEGRAWLSLRLRGKQYRWTMKVEDDWVDPSVFIRLEELLARSGSKRRLIYYDLRGQDCLILCGTPAFLHSLRKETGLSFEWMTQPVKRASPIRR